VGKEFCWDRGGQNEEKKIRGKKHLLNHGYALVWAGPKRGGPTGLHRGRNAGHRKKAINGTISKHIQSKGPNWKSTIPLLKGKLQ